MKFKDQGWNQRMKRLEPRTNSNPAPLKTKKPMMLEAPPQAMGTNESRNQVKLGNEIQRSRPESETEKKTQEIRGS